MVSQKISFPASPPFNMSISFLSIVFLHCFFLKINSKIILWIIFRMYGTFKNAKPAFNNSGSAFMICTIVTIIIILNYYYFNILRTPESFLHYQFDPEWEALLLQAYRVCQAPSTYILPVYDKEVLLPSSRYPVYQ